MLGLGSKDVRSLSVAPRYLLHFPTCVSSSSFPVYVRSSCLFFLLSSYPPIPILLRFIPPRCPSTPNASRPAPSCLPTLSRLPLLSHRIAPQPCTPRRCLRRPWAGLEYLLSDCHQAGSGWALEDERKRTGAGVDRKRNAPVGGDGVWRTREEKGSWPELWRTSQASVSCPQYPREETWGGLATRR